MYGGEIVWKGDGSGAAALSANNVGHLDLSQELPSK
jgi:hypothetical protein